MHKRLTLPIVAFALTMAVAGPAHATESAPLGRVTLVSSTAPIHYSYQSCVQPKQIGPIPSAVSFANAPIAGCAALLVKGALLRPVRGPRRYP